MEINQNLSDTLNNINIIYHKLDNIQIDHFLEENHKKLFQLLDKTSEMTDWKSFQNLPPLKHYTEDKMTLFYLEHEFLYSLNPKYSLSLSENCKKIKANKEAFYSRRLNKDWYRVYYEFNSTIEDFSVLTHEYIHHLSAQFPKIKTDTSAYSVYTECLSLLGELKCLDFLKSISSSQDEINKCIKIIRNRYQQNINHFLTIEPLLDIYLSKYKSTS